MMSSIKVLSASFLYLTQRMPLKNCLKCVLLRLKYYLGSWDIWIFVNFFPCSTCYLEVGKYGPTIIFGIQKPLSIKVPKMTWWWINKQIKFLYIFDNLYITSSIPLVFHNNAFVGQSFCKNN